MAHQPRHIFVFMAMLLLLTTLVLATHTNKPKQSTGEWTQAALDDEIIDLPDAPKFSRHFSGYIQANYTNMFYWLVMAKNNPETATTLWWSSGGPGCSGLLGMLTEMSAYQAVSDGKGGAKLAIRDSNWNENFNIVYVEQPDVGFTNIPREFTPPEWTDQEAAKRNADFLEAFFRRYPNLKANPFGISSESYGGHYIPTLARELISRINAGRSTINFKYSIVGNPLIYLPMADYGLYKMAIDRQMVPRYPVGTEYITLCEPDVHSYGNPPKPRPDRCFELERLMDLYLLRTDPYAMDFPICIDSQTGMVKPGGTVYGQHILQQRAKVQKSYRKQRTLQDTLDLQQEAILNDIINQSSLTTPEDDYFPPRYQACEEDYATMYLNRKDVQKALHANLKRSSWSMCEDIPYSDHDQIENMLPIYLDNSIKGPYVQQLIFSGSTDRVCSTQELQMSVFNNYKTVKYWEPIEYKGQLLGYKSTFTEPKTLTVATVHGAGHMVPQTRPQFGKAMLERFIEGTL